MSCQNENTFLRFSDTPTLDNAGFVKVASSKDQLDNMSLEDKERIVASVALLDSFTEGLSDTINNLVNNNLKNTDLNLDEKVQEIVEKLGQNRDTTSLDINFLKLLPRLEGAELRWLKPNYNKPFQVDIFKSTSNSYENAVKIDTINGKQDFYVINLTNEEMTGDNLPYFFVQAFDNDNRGNKSEIVGFESRNWSDLLVQYLRGKITETALSRELINSIYTGFGNTLNAEINKTLSQAREQVKQAENTINNVISGIRQNFDTEIVNVKGQLVDQGNNITKLEKKSDGLAETIERISAVANNAVAGIQAEKIARATENEAFARETNTRIAQVNDSISTVRDELKVHSDNFQSQTTKIEDLRNSFGQSEVRTTQQLNQLATADQALSERISQTDTKVQGASTKIQQLEQSQVTKDRAVAKRFSSLRSSINGSHFPNYNFEGELEGWTTNTNTILTYKRVEDPSAPRPELVELSGNMPLTIYSDEPTQIDKTKTYSFRANLKSPDRLVKAQLVMMCFDKNKQLIANVQTNPQYPLIDSAQNKGTNWVTLQGKISGHTTEWPSSDNTKMPLNTAYATPALIVESVTGGKVWVTELDMQDTSAEENNLAEIKKLETTVTTANESTATKLEELESNLRDAKTGIAGNAKANEQLRSNVEVVSGRVQSTADKVQQLEGSVGENLGKINKLSKVVTDSFSSTATELKEIKTKFRRDLSNVIENPLFEKTEEVRTVNSEGQEVVTGTRVVNSTDNWNSEPKNKLRVISPDDIQTNFKTKYPANRYLRFWGNTLTPLNKLPVTPGDKILLGTAVQTFNSTPSSYKVYVRYSDKEGQLLSNIEIPANSEQERQYRYLSTLTVPEGAVNAELVYFLGSDTLAENQGIIIAKPELRMNMAAIYSDSKIEEAKTSISNAHEALAQKVERYEAEFNGKVARVQDEVTATADKEKALASKVKTLETKAENAEGKLRTLEGVEARANSFTTTKIQEAEGRVNTLVNGVRVDSESAIRNVEKTVNDTEKALTTKIEENKSKFETDLTRANSEITTTKETLTTATQAINTKIDQQKSKFENEFVRANSAIQQAQRTANSANESVASLQRTTQSNLNGLTSKVNSIESAISGRDTTSAGFARDLEARFNAKKAEAIRDAENAQPKIITVIGTNHNTSTTDRAKAGVYIDGARVGNNPARGFNLLTLNKQTLAVTSQFNFDTYANTTTNHQAFLNKLNELKNSNDLVLFYSYDETRPSDLLYQALHFMFPTLPSEADKRKTAFNENSRSSCIGVYDKESGNCNVNSVSDPRNIAASITLKNGKASFNTSGVSADKLAKIKSDIDSGKVYATETRTKLDNLKIGARNYLTATETMKNWKSGVRVWHYNKHASEPQGRIEPENGEVILYGTTTTWKEWYQIARMGTQHASDSAAPSLPKVQVGRQYNLSFEAKVETDANPTTHNKIWAKFREYRNTAPASVEKKQEFTITSEWRKYDFTFDVAYHTSAVDFNRWTVLFTSSTNGRIRIRKPMLVEGNVPVDWSPAPEDTEVINQEFSAKLDEYERTMTNDRLAVATKIDYIESALNKSANLVYDSEFKEGLKTHNYPTDPNLNHNTGLIRGIVGFAPKGANTDWLNTIQVKDGLTVGYVGDVDHITPKRYNYASTDVEIPSPGKYQVSMYLRNLTDGFTGFFIEARDQNHNNISLPSGTPSRYLLGKRSPDKRNKTTTIGLDDFDRVVVNLDYTAIANCRYIRVGVFSSTGSRQNHNVVLFTKPQIIKISNYNDNTIYPYSPGPDASTPYSTYKEIKQSITTETASTVEKINQFKSKFPSSLGGTANNEALANFNNVLKTEADKSSANFSNEIKLKVAQALGGNSATQFEAKLRETKEIAADAQGKVKAKIGLSVDSGGRITGWEANENPDRTKRQSSDFKISADHFRIQTSNGAYTPFEVDGRTGEVFFRGKVNFTGMSPTGLDLGGRNYIRNSFTERTGTNSGTNGATLPVVQSFVNQDPRTFTISCDYEIVGNNNTTYTTANRAGCEVKINYTDNSVAYLGAWTQSNGKGRVSKTIEIPNGKKVRNIENCIIQTRLTATTIKISNPKLELGRVATDWTPAPEDGLTQAQVDTITQARIDNMNLGGRNYLQGSLPHTDYWKFNKENGSTATGTFVTDSSGNYLRISASGDTNTRWKQWQCISESTYLGITKFSPTLRELKSGDVVTVSFEARSSQANFPIRIYIRNDDTPSQKNCDLIRDERVTILNNSWKRYSFTTTLRTHDAPNPNRRYRLLFDAYFLSGNNTFDFRKIKIERGNKATDWNLSVEEIEQLANLARSEATSKSEAVKTALNPLITAAKDRADEGVRNANTAKELAELMSIVNSVGPNTRVVGLSDDPRNASYQKVNPEFRENNLNGISPYDNGRTGRVAVSRVSRSTDNPTTSTHEMNVRITNGANPGYGGFYRSIFPGKINAIVVHKYLMKFSDRFFITCHNNQLGNGGWNRVVGNARGTNKFSWYYVVTQYGNSGTVGTAGHIAFNHGSGAALTGTQTYDVRVASVEQFILTENDNELFYRKVRETTEIDGGNIKTGTIDVNRLSSDIISSGVNLIQNSGFVGVGHKVSNWAIGWSTVPKYSKTHSVGHNGSTTLSPDSTRPHWALLSTQMLDGEHTLNLDQTTSELLQIYQIVAVKPNSHYLLSYWYQNHGLPHTFRLDVSSSHGGWELNSTHETTLVEVQPGSPWVNRRADDNTRVVYKISTGPNTAFINLIWGIPGNGRKHFALAKPMLEEVRSDIVSPSKFKMGTTITAHNIDVPTLSSLSSNIGHITAGTIEASVIKAQDLVITSGRNLLKNPELWSKAHNNDSYNAWSVVGPAGWAENPIGNRQFKVQAFHNWGTDSYRGGNRMAAGECAIKLIAHNTTTADREWIIAMSQYVQLKPGRTYIYSIQGVIYRANSGCLVEEYNDNGYVKSLGEIDLVNNVTGADRPADKWTRKWIKFTVPSSATGRCRVFIGLIGNGTAQANPDGYFYRPMLEEVHPNATGPSEWSGSGTIIDPSSISTGTLSSISADMGHINAGSMNIGSRFIINTDGTIRIGSKAHGVVIDANGMRVYDGTVLKVRIGNLSNKLAD